MVLKAIVIENFKHIREPVPAELIPVALLFCANSAPSKCPFVGEEAEDAAV